MKNIFCLLFFVPFLVFQACTTDAGYDPSSRYIDKKVDYYIENGHEMPKCNKSSEGTVIFIERELDVYACIDSVWTFCRKLSAGAPELYDAILYDESSGIDKETENRKKNGIPYETSSIVDSRDGRKYKTVIVDGMEWMAENLDYDNGKNSIVHSGCSDEFGEKNCRMYFANTSDYSYMNVIDSSCPAGFMLPSENRWLQLIAAVGGTDVAGQILKDESFSVNKKHPAYNSISFSVLATGYETIYFSLLTSATGTALEVGVGETAMFWTASRSVVRFDVDRDDVVFMSMPGSAPVRCMRLL